jgi:hypothetical protein
MEYVKVKNWEVEVYPYTIAKLKKDNPNTSFPEKISDTLLASFDVYPVTVRNAPGYNSMVQSISRQKPILQGNDWVVDWSVENLPEEAAVRNVRARRNDLLQKSDWTQLSDATVDAVAWATYRQSLRDLPAQSGFPYNVIWPAEPA